MNKLIIFIIISCLFSIAAGQPAGQAVSSSANSTDACAATPVASYNLGFHVAGVFIIMFTSFAGLFGTLLPGNFSKRPMVVVFLQIFKMFGIGVVAATAWIHLLPDAFSQFGSSCLEGYWTVYGTNYVGLFGLIGAFLVQYIEVASVGHMNSLKKKTNITNRSRSSSIAIQPLTQSEGDSTVVAVPAAAYIKETEEEEDSKYNDNMKQLQTIILEFGILIHSAVIGVTLGVTPDDHFTTLMVALIFHQLFEGMALGALISATSLKRYAKYFLGVLYPITTPLGIAIGIGVRNSYNGNSQQLIVTQGILDSLSAGILMYNTYCELMSEEINHRESFYEYSLRFKAACFFSMYLGATCMAVVGIYA